ncbi:amidohydrolase [uncultured Algibacter sp.]|uniref:amidohydrolase n=1 Tax=uncultured Algibacter sp. TaxID=298659 RepID=UPI002632580C|nr:amidohydrolase [uncultured Algibacter sp.]
MNTFKKTVKSAIVLIVLTLIVSCKSEKKEDAADMVFTNGKVYTVNKNEPWAESVAIKDDKIVFVGSSEEAKKYIDEHTETTDLNGKMMLPGFVDAHSHPIAGGLIMTGIDLQSDDTNEIFNKLKKYVTKNSDHKIVQGYGVRFNPWNGNWPTAKMLDEIESERPVYLWTIDGHGAWVNSKALELAGIDKNTPEPVPGYSFFTRDNEGNPTGWIVELPAQMQVLNALVKVDSDYIARGVAEWLPRFAASGLTSIQDLGMGGQPEDMGFALFQKLEEEGKLPIRLQGVYYWNNPEIDPIPEIVRLRKTFNSELVKATHLKINVDGGDDKHNALYVDGYADKPELKVDPIIPVAIINDAVHRADSLGIDIASHCFGDGAVRIILDAVELARKANPDRKRYNLINHGLLIHPDDYSRFKELDVAYETTGAWMSLDPAMIDITMKRLGEERVNLYAPVNKIHALGGRVALGSDWPVSGYISEYRPLSEIQGAVTRQLPGRENFPPLGGESAKIPLDLALFMQTYGAADAMGISNITGSIEKGKKADLVILEKNLFDVQPNEISTVKVLSTMLNGKYTHQSN